MEVVYTLHERWSVIISLSNNSNKVSWTGIWEPASKNLMVYTGLVMYNMKKWFGAMHLVVFCVELAMGTFLSQDVKSCHVWLCINDITFLFKYYVKVRELYHKHTLMCWNSLLPMQGIQLRKAVAALIAAFYMQTLVIPNIDLRCTNFPSYITLGFNN